MSEPRVIYRRTDRNPERAGRPPVRGSLNTRRLRAASPLATANPHSRRASTSVGRVVLLLGVLVVLAVAVVVAASRPAGALSCVPAEQPCDAVGDPPPAMPYRPLGACVPGEVAMCVRAALPVVMR